MLRKKQQEVERKQQPSNETQLLKRQTIKELIAPILEYEPHSGAAAPQPPCDLAQNRIDNILYFALPILCQSAFL